MAGCYLNGLCGSSPPDMLKSPLDNPVIAPFVIVTILGQQNAVNAQAFAPAITKDIGGQTQFSEGNQSFPATVKSVQIGGSKGFGFDIEIVDQEGGDFRTIMEKLSRGGAGSDNLCQVQWGWLTADCDGSSSQLPPPGSGDPTENQSVSSKIVQLMIKNITLDYSFGVVKYTLHCIDLLQDMNQTVVSGVFGDANNKVYLTDAIQELCKKFSVTPMYKNYTTATTEGAFTWKATQDGTVNKMKGPKGVWPGNNRSVLACIYEWLRPYVADSGESGKGLTVYYNPQDKGQIIIQVGIAPVCESNFAAKYQVAAYVVNGGNCSPVISFKPNIAWTPWNAYLSGGTGQGARGGGTTDQKDVIPDCLKKQLPNIINSTNSKIRTGFKVDLTTYRNETLARRQQAQRYAYNNKYLNNLANTPLGTSTITAELRVQGDPSFSNPALYLHRFINLTVINPFAVEQPCQWLNTIQPCNEILSNANWLIEGISHDIRDGSYTTTFKLRLLFPGWDIPFDAPVGDVGNVNL